MALLDAPVNTTPPLSSIVGLGLVPCVTRGYPPCSDPGIYSDGTKTTVTYFVPYVAAFDFTNPRLMFANAAWDISGSKSGEQIGLPPITITCSISTDYTYGGTPEKTFVVATFGNQAATVLKGGQIVYSDPVPISFRQGELFLVRTCVTVQSAGQIWGLNGVTLDQLGTAPSWTTNNGQVGRIDGQDATQQGAPVPTPTNYATFFGPSGIFANPGYQGQPGVAVFGDSIAEGYQDTWPGYQGAQVYQEGFLTRALRNSGHGVLNLASGGDQAAECAQRGWMQVRLLMAAGSCKHAVILLGRNDLTGGATAATLQANLTAVWRTIAGTGMKVWALTIPPASTSTDNWTTTANQTTLANNAQRVLVNAWLRAGAPLASASNLTPVAVGTAGAIVAGNAGHPLAGVFDVATPLETAQDSGIWKVDFTGTCNTVQGSYAVTNLAGGAFTKSMYVAGPAGNNGVPGGSFLKTNPIGGSASLNNSCNATVNGATIASVYTWQGIHPTPQGYYAGSAAITPASFA